MGWKVGTAATAAQSVQRRLQALQAESRSLQMLVPSPTESAAENIESALLYSQASAWRLRESLQPTGSEVERRAAALVPRSGTEAYFEIAALVERMKSKARERHVGLEVEERFGFQEFATTEPAGHQTEHVLRDCRVAEYVLSALFAAEPQRLIGFQRGQPVTVVGERASAREDGFLADWARTEADLKRIHSAAYRLVFAGETPALRGLLNRLAEFRLPVVVRSVAAEAIEASGKVLASSETAGVLRPVTRRTLTRFTVTLELVELLEGVPTT